VYTSTDTRRHVYTHAYTQDKSTTHTHTHRHTHTHTLSPLSLTHTHGLLLSLRHTQPVEKLLADAKKDLADAKKDLDAAEKQLAAAKKNLDADPKNEVLQLILSSKLSLFASANKDVLSYSERRRKILQDDAKLYDASIRYRPHEIKDIEDENIPKIVPIPVNRGQTSLVAPSCPWTKDTPLQYILSITTYKSCQISQDVINFLTANVEFLKTDPHASENRIQPLVNFFTNIVKDTVGDNVVTFQRNRQDPSSQSESGSPKRKLYRPDVIYFVNGLPLVRIEEKAKSKDLSVAQAELVNKISQDWLTVECTTRFVIGIAVAGNIWTFHRITCEDVRKCRQNKHHVVKEWLRINILEDIGRLRGVQVAVHIASLLKFFAENVHPRTVEFGKKIKRNQSHIKITSNTALGLHVKKWYVSQIQCYSDICLLSSMHAVIYICNHKRLV